MGIGMWLASGGGGVAGLAFAETVANGGFQSNPSGPTGIFFLTANPADGETVTIGGITYEFVTTITNVGNEVLIGATAADTLFNLVQAITAGQGAGTIYSDDITVPNPNVTASAADTKVIIVGGGDPLLQGDGWSTTDKSANFAISEQFKRWTKTAGGTAHHAGRTLVGKTTGKFYWELTVLDDTNNDLHLGFVNDAQVFSGTHFLGQNANSYAYESGGNKRFNGVSSAYGTGIVAGDVVGVALDLTNGAVWFRRQGTWQAGATQAEIEAGNTTNAAFTGVASDTWFPAYSSFSVNTSAKANFGDTAFRDTPPAGFTPGWPSS